MATDPQVVKATLELFDAVENQQNEKVVRALNHKADPNGVDEETRRMGITPMHAACMETGSSTDIMRLLVTYGGKLDSYTDFRQTPMSLAVRKNNRNMCRLLHTCKVDINQKFIKNEECTGLIVASKYGHSEIVKLFCKWGADLDATDLHGKTAMDYATEGGFIKVQELLEKAAKKAAKAAKENGDANANGGEANGD